MKKENVYQILLFTCVRICTCICVLGMYETEAYHMTSRLGVK